MNFNEACEAAEGERCVACQNPGECAAEGACVFYTEMPEEADMADVIFRMRLTPANLEVMKGGIKVDTVQFVEGADGIYELYITGHGEEPLPDAGVTPTVPPLQRW